MKPRIPKPHEDSPVDVVAIKDLPRSLEDLVARITPENRHDEIGSGTAVGNEVC
jgi:antitoxin component of MazEF toxin-antitoxin module